jgi:PhnB protein
MSPANTKTPALNPVPEARGATPYLTVKGAPDAIAFYQRVFGAQLTFRLNDPSGGVMHAEMRVGPATFMLSEERPEYGARGPKAIGGSAVTVIVYVPDVDATFKLALESGATATMPLENQFWGDRAGGITDPFGHQWMVASHIEDPTPQELERRAKALFAKGA